MVAEKIEQVGIEQALGERFGAYSKYIIQERAIPDVRDGLKPVHRRILFAMFMLGNTHNKAYVKSARSVGDVIGKYHPHGDSSVYSALARMSQDWSVGVKLIDMQGNNGSIDGDAPAAMRYTEARLQKVVDEAMMAGIKKKGIVPMVKNFDDTLDEPVVLPAQFPNLLVQGSSGISAGYASDIIPHNFSEVLKGCIALLEDPEVTLDTLMDLIPAPDLPTGGVIVGAKNMKSVYETGKGRVVVRAAYRVEETRKGKKIVINEIPFGVKKSTLIEKMGDVVADKAVVGLVDVNDETSSEGLQIVVELTKDADVNVVLGYLFKKTPLQTNLSMNMVVIKDRKPTLIGIREALVAFNEFRLETRRKELEYDKLKLEERLHIIDGFVKLTEIVDDVVKEIKESSGRADAKKRLQKVFEFTEQQSEAIVSLQLHRISKTDKKAYLEEQKKLNRMLSTVTALLNSKKKFVKSVIKGYEKLIEEFGTDRKTKVVMEDENWDVRKVDIIAEEDVMVSVSKDGYLKRSSLRSHGSTAVPGFVDGDASMFEGKVTTKDVVMLFTNKLNYLYLPVHEFEECRWGDTGKHIASYVRLAEGERLVSAFAAGEQDAGKYILLAKSNGQVKRTTVAAHEVSRRYWNTYEAIKQRTDEELVGAWLVEDTGYIGFADATKKKMYFAIDEIAPKGLKTEGMRGIHMDEKANEKISDCQFHLEEKGFRKAWKYRPRGQKGWR